MIWAVILSFAVAALATLGVIVSASRHAHWSADHDLSGPQKMHANAVPRVGGIGIALGAIVGGYMLQDGQAHSALMLALCALPVFATGLLEDFTKRVSPRRRLAAAAVSAALGAWLLKAMVTGIGLDLLGDEGWAGHLGLAVSVGLTMFAVAGVSNAVNIIDGMNGLASMSSTLMLLALAGIALQVGDPVVAHLALAMAAATLGFFVWNYPRGLIFLGDGGAYLLGFIIAELGLMLITRNPAVSPVAPLLVVSYPVLETLFTMYRRKVLRGHAMSHPDGIHLHTLIYRRLMRWTADPSDHHARARSNSRTSPLLWAISAIALIPALLWWNNTTALALSAVTFALVYVHLYWRIVQFRTPRWLSAHASRDAEEPSGLPKHHHPH